MRIFVAVTVMVANLALLQACNHSSAGNPAHAANPAREDRVTTPAKSFKDLAYRRIDGADLHLDAYIHPTAAIKPSPVLMYFHGGGWARGQKPANWKSFSSYLNAGFSVVAVEYRLSGVAPAPAAVQDVRCAMSWVNNNANRLGFDVDRIVVYGTSAGGHLALMAGMLPAGNDIDSPDCPGIPNAAAIVNFYGPADLNITTPKGTRHPSVARWIGKRDDAIAMEKKMSPINYIRADQPPVFTAHGDADPVVPVEGSKKFKTKLDEAGVPNSLYIISGGQHGKFSPQEKVALQRHIVTFLEKHGILAD